MSSVRVRVEEFYHSPHHSMQLREPKNVLGETLKPCSTDPTTGFYRTGGCESGPDDIGRHVVCAEMTEAFLRFSKQQGNDLSTPRSDMNFPGLTPGDRWCVCAERWKVAQQAGVAPPVILKATNEMALQIIDREVLQAHALDGE